MDAEVIAAYEAAQKEAARLGLTFDAAGQAVFVRRMGIALHADRSIEGAIVFLKGFKMGMDMR